MFRLIAVILISLMVGGSKSRNDTLDKNNNVIYMPFVSTPEPEKGAAWAWQKNHEDEELLGIEWYYSYGVNPSPNIEADFVPFLWCDRWPPHDYIFGRDYFESWRINGLDTYVGYALILNEPDLEGTEDGGQCDRTPRQAAYIYKQALELCPGCVWVGPAPSHIDYYNNWAWLKSFYNYLMACKIPPPKVGAIHTYIINQNPQMIVDSYFKMLRAYPNSPKTVWVTEFGSADERVVESMLQTWERDPRVTRWAYFAPRIPPDAGSVLYQLTLIDKYGRLTPAGRAFIRNR